MPIEHQRYKNTYSAYFKQELHMHNIKTAEESSSAVLSMVSECSCWESSAHNTTWENCPSVLHVTINLPVYENTYPTHNISNAGSPEKLHWIFPMGYPLWDAGITWKANACTLQTR